MQLRMYLLQVDATDSPTDQLLTDRPAGRKTKPALVYISFDDNAVR